MFIFVQPAGMHIYVHQQCACGAQRSTDWSWRRCFVLHRIAAVLDITITKITVWTQGVSHCAEFSIFSLTMLQSVSCSAGVHGADMAAAVQHRVDRAGFSTWALTVKENPPQDVSGTGVRMNRVQQVQQRRPKSDVPQKVLPARACLES